MFSLSCFPWIYRNGLRRTPQSLHKIAFFLLLLGSKISYKNCYRVSQLIFYKVKQLWRIKQHKHLEYLVLFIYINFIFLYTYVFLE